MEQKEKKKLTKTILLPAPRSSLVISQQQLHRQLLFFFLYFYILLLLQPSSTQQSFSPSSQLVQTLSILFLLLHHFPIDTYFSYNIFMFESFSAHFPAGAIYNCSSSINGSMQKQLQQLKPQTANFALSTSPLCLYAGCIFLRDCFNNSAHPNGKTFLDNYIAGNYCFDYNTRPNI